MSIAKALVKSVKVKGLKKLAKPKTLKKIVKPLKKTVKGVCKSCCADCLP